MSERPGERWPERPAAKQQERGAPSERPGERLGPSGPPPQATAGRLDPRLPAYVAATAVALAAALVVGRPDLAATAAPFAVLAARGVGDRRPPGPRAHVEVAAARVLEGDEIVGRVTVEWEGEAEVEVLLSPLPGVTPVAPSPVLGWALPVTRGPVTLPFRLRARAWGRHRLGRVHVRSRRPGGLVWWEEAVASGPTVRVLPGPLRLDRLLHPVEPRAVAGAHLSRQRGEGTDFAELRRYAPGDRLRDVSWSTSARLGEPWVIVHHPERTGTVVLLLDAFFDASAPSTEALARAAQAAWAVAAAHLRAQDRIGLLAVGRATAWLPPLAGRRARWRLLDELLAVGAMAEDRRSPIHRERGAVPPDALVVGVTSLRSPTFARDLLHHRRSGRTTAALVIDTADLLPPSGDRVEAAAQRLWRAELDVARHSLERAGVPTALVTAAGGVAPAISVLRRATSRRPGRSLAPSR